MTDRVGAAANMPLERRRLASARSPPLTAGVRRSEDLV
jgi:hypothetical protein